MVADGRDCAAAQPLADVSTDASTTDALDRDRATRSTRLPGALMKQMRTPGRTVVGSLV